MEKASTKAFDNIEIFVRSAIPTAKTQWIDSDNLQIVNGSVSAAVLTALWMSVDSGSGCREFKGKHPFESRVLI